MKFSDFFLGVFLKNRIFLPAIVQNNRVKNGSIVQFEQNV